MPNNIHFNTKPTHEAIVAVYNLFDEDDRDTDVVFSMVCDHFHNLIDHGDVADALFACLRGE